MMRKYSNTGKPPRDGSVEIRVEWANGLESRFTYRAEQLNFALRDHPYDIAKFWRVDGKDKYQSEARV
jgi:hypothetical protein